MKTHYYIHINDGTQARNNLDKAISTYLRSIDGKLVEADKLNEVKKTILREISLFNETHKRCKPFKVSFWKPGTGGGCYALSGYYTEYLYIYPAELVKQI